MKERERVSAFSSSIFYFHVMSRSVFSIWISQTVIDVQNFYTYFLYQFGRFPLVSFFLSQYILFPILSWFSPRSHFLVGIKAKMKYWIFVSQCKNERAHTIEQCSFIHRMINRA